MVDAPQTGEAAIHGAYRDAWRVTDCEATPRAGVTLATAKLTCHLTLEMSPTEA